MMMMMMVMSSSASRKKKKKCAELRGDTASAEVELSGGAGMVVMVVNHLTTLSAGRTCSSEKNGACTVFPVSATVVSRLTVEVAVAVQ